MADHRYDLIIIGLGSAGCHVVREVMDRPSLRELRVAVVDDFSEGYQDKTWSYWERGSGYWDDLITKSWGHGLYVTREGAERPLTLHPYHYKSVTNRAVIEHMRQRISAHPSIDYIEGRVDEAHEMSQRVEIRLADGAVLDAAFVLDSRLPAAAKSAEEGIHLLQHFLGWEVEVDAPTWREDRFTMMDFSISESAATRFIYVLPWSQTKALVECTYFSNEVVPEDTYEGYLRAHLADTLGVDAYEVTMVEKGVIPMTTYDFSRHHSDRIIKIGTAGGWVKPSTGYSFKRSERLASALVDSIVSHGRPSPPSMSRLEQLFDATLLDVLDTDNGHGPAVFDRLFEAHPIQRIFRLLDDESSLMDKLRIMTSLTSWRMIRSFWRAI